MKKILSLILVFLFLTGCAVNNLPTESKYSKETLIKKANNGDITAMLELAKYYKYPEVIEGLQYFDKWYASIDEKDDPMLVAQIADVYYTYNDMFLDGENKALKLLNQAANQGSLEAKVTLIKHYVTTYKTYEAKKLEEEIIDKLSLEQLQNLYTIYTDKYRRIEAEKVVSYIVERGGSLPFDEQMKEIKSIFFKVDSQEKIEAFISNVIKTQDIEKMSNTADLFKDKYRFQEASTIYEEILKLDNNNANAYFKLSTIYAKGYSRQNIKKDVEKAEEYLKKAAALNHEEATLELLKAYSQNRETVNEYFKLKHKIEKNPETLLLLAKYYKQKRQTEKADAIFDKLATLGNQEAIIDLALRIPSRYYFNPEEYVISQKWQKYIYESKDNELKTNFLDKATKNYSFKTAFPDLIEKLNEEKLASNNIIELREFAQKNRYNNPELSIKFYEKASKAGDIKSSLELINIYIGRKVKKYAEAEKILINLSQKGDVKATYRLADFYMNPPYYMDEKPNHEKGLAVYEELAEKGDIKAMEKLLNYHLCNSCKESPKQDEVKGFYYLKKLFEIRKTPRDYASMGWSYNYGKGVEQDLLKAEEYYLLAAQKGYYAAYYNLAWLYYKDDRFKDLKLIRLDYLKAKEYLEKGIEKHHYESMNLLGVFYKDGLGVKKDMTKAIPLFEKAAYYDKYAAIHLAKYYKEKKDYKNAFKYFKIGKDKGDAAAEIEFGILHEKGLGTEKNVEEAVKYYQRAYENYYDKSQKDVAAYNIGLVYHYGKGKVKKDLEKAKSWYLKSKHSKAKIELEKIEKLKK